MTATATRTTNPWHLLLQLSSPSLPVGAFSYSQGLESAIDLGLVRDEASTGRWIRRCLLDVQARGEAVIWLLIARAVHDGNWAAVAQWNRWFWASRETAELRQEAEQMGWSMRKLAMDLRWGSDDQRQHLSQLQPVCLVTVHAYACAVHGIGQPVHDSRLGPQGQQPDGGGVSLEQALWAMLFAWTENQVMAAVKAVPLGQSAGQRIVQAASPVIAQAVTLAQQLACANPPRPQTSAPMLSVLSARHEQQYSRLFRS